MHFISKVPAEGIVIGEERYNPRQLRTGLGFVAVPLFFYSSTLSTIFYIIGEYLQALLHCSNLALGIRRVDSPLSSCPDPYLGASAVSILGHAAFTQEHIEGDFTDNVV